MNIPEPTRLSLSGYVQHGKLLPWNGVDRRMARSRNYWLSVSIIWYAIYVRSDVTLFSVLD